jgi:SAM-dependent methyltransferase
MNQMPDVEILTISKAPLSAEEFPDEWYKHSGSDHFWMQWRIEAFERQYRSLGLSGREKWRGLDIGGGRGVVQNQLEKSTNWIVDCCDLNMPALSASIGGRGRTIFYDIFDRRQEFAAAYDFLILFDVIEHIEDPVVFLNAALFHLKPGGYVFVNVPALMWLYSEYDRVAGHVRRFDVSSLRSLLNEVELSNGDLRYWGGSMIPVLGARKLIMSGDMASADAIRLGFKPPGSLADAFLRSLKFIESAVMPLPPLGTSLLAAVRKPVDRLR